MKNVLSILGILLVTYVLIGNNLSYITNWSTAELVGYNIWTVIVIIGAGYIIYRILNPKRKDANSDDEHKPDIL